MGCKVMTDSEVYKLFRLENLANQVKFSIDYSSNEMKFFVF